MIACADLFGKMFRNTKHPPDARIRVRGMF